VPDDFIDETTTKASRVLDALGETKDAFLETLKWIILMDGEDFLALKQSLENALTEKFNEIFGRHVISTD